MSWWLSPRRWAFLPVQARRPNSRRPLQGRSRPPRLPPRDRNTALRSKKSRAKPPAAAAIEEAKKNNWRMVIAVVGTDGELVYLERMDGTQNASSALAQSKARTSALYRQASKTFADQFASG